MTKFVPFVLDTDRDLSKTLGSDVVSMDYQFEEMEATLVVTVDYREGVDRKNARPVLLAGKGLQFWVCVSQRSEPKPGYTLKLPIIEGKFVLKGFRVTSEGYKLRFKRQIRKRDP